jgi:hypothetical protein
MPELHPNGNYEAYLAQLFNPLAGGAQFNPGVWNTIGGGGIGTGLGGLGAGTVPNMSTLLQTPWSTQNPQQMNAVWPQQQQQNPAQTLPAIQLAQHIATKQAAQAIQYAQALQALQQLVQNLATQQAIGPQGQYQAQFGQGIGGAYGIGQIGYGLAQPYGLGMQNPLQQQALQQQMLQQQILQQQVLQQLAQYLASQQPQFRYGLAA